MDASQDLPSEAQAKNASSSKNTALKTEEDFAKSTAQLSRGKSEAQAGGPEPVTTQVRSDSKRIKLSYLDYLANPLRSEHPFGKFN